MTPAALSLAALLAAILVSLTSRINVGLLAITLAWLIGVYAAGWKVEAVFAGFPAQLFLTLAGVTLLFSLAQANGSIERVARRLVVLVRGDVALLPFLFFLLAGVISSVGPGAIASTALVAPLAMGVAARAGIPSFLTALMVANGANAGNLSPISSVGVVVNAIMARNGLPGAEAKVFAANVIAHLAVAVLAYALFGGAALLAARRRHGAGAADPPPAYERRHVVTLAVIAVWIAGVILLDLNPGLGAFAAASVLVLSRAGDEREAFRLAPWSIILMVSGVTVLISVLEKTGGLDLFTGLLARLASPATVNGVIAFVTGLVSSYSSTSGVVLPAFLPTVPGLVAKLGGGDPLAVALSINVGSALVDVSPLSTLGALCVAAALGREDAHGLFRKLLLWGLSMTLVGGLICLFFAGPFARL